MIKFSKSDNSFEIVLFWKIRLGIMKSADQHGAFIMISIAIWMLGLTLTFSKYDKIKGSVMYGES